MRRPFPCAAKARTEAEDSQRLLLAALNGLAGLLLLQNRQPEAAAAYREALATGESTAGALGAPGGIRLATLPRVLTQLRCSLPQAAQCIPSSLSVALGAAWSKVAEQGDGLPQAG